jgi:hypothetical protein
MAEPPGAGGVGDGDGVADGVGVADGAGRGLGFRDRGHRVGAPDHEETERDRDVSGPDPARDGAPGGDDRGNTD